MHENIIENKQKSQVDIVTLIGKKHMKEILFSLNEQPCGFNDLVGKLKVISAKVLSENLKILESAGLVKRDVRTDSPLRVNYSITMRGVKVVEALKKLSEAAITEVSENVGLEMRKVQ